MPIFSYKPKIFTIAAILRQNFTNRSTKVSFRSAGLSCVTLLEEFFEKGCCSYNQLQASHIQVDTFHMSIDPIILKILKIPENSSFFNTINRNT